MVDKEAEFPCKENARTTIQKKVVEAVKKMKSAALMFLFYNVPMFLVKMAEEKQLEPRLARGLQRGF